MNLDLDVAANRIPFSGNWVGAWAMNTPQFNALYEQLSKLNIRAHLDSIRSEADEQILADTDSTYRVDVVNGIAIVNLRGPMMKHRSSFGSSCSTVETRRALLQCKRDASVRGICLKIESPGGTVAGTMELAETVASLDKPTMAFCADLTASAAYWVASQCDSISANQMALVGSIGTYSIVVDSSKAFDKAGYKVHVIRAGEFKGVGAPGTEISEKHLQESQDLINAINDHFLSAVERGREMKQSKVKKLADGRVHLASDAKSYGLIDDVSTFEKAFNNFESKVLGQAPSRETRSSFTLGSATSQDNLPAEPESSASEKNDMADAANKPVTAQELKDRFTKSTAEWRLKALENGWTMQQCVESYAEQQEARAEAAEEQLAQERDKNQRRSRRPGAKALRTGPKSSRRWGARAEDGDDEEMSEDEDHEAMDDEDEGDETEGDASATWQSEFAKALKQSGGNRQKALSLANRRNPGLRKAMLAEHNTGRRIR